MVRLKGLEPSRRGHQILSLARLPIPPQAHIKFYLLIFTRERYTEEEQKSLFLIYENGKTVITLNNNLTKHIILTLSYRYIIPIKLYFVKSFAEKNQKIELYNLL